MNLKWSANYIVRSYHVCDVYVVVEHMWKVPFIFSYISIWTLSISGLWLYVHNSKINVLQHTWNYFPFAGCFLNMHRWSTFWNILINSIESQTNDLFLLCALHLEIFRPLTYSFQKSNIDGRELHSGRNINTLDRSRIWSVVYLAPHSTIRFPETLILLHNKLVWSFKFHKFFDCSRILFPFWQVCSIRIAGENRRK